MITEKHFNQAKEQHQKRMADMIQLMGKTKNNSRSFEIDSKMHVDKVRDEIKKLNLKKVIGIYGIFVEPKHVNKIKAAVTQFRDKRG